MKTDSLFEWIEQQEAKRGSDAWGRVLDAGTGLHSSKWLLSLSNSITQLDAVTGEPNLANRLRDEAPHNGVQLEIHSGNWAEENFLEGKMFDVVIADYLVGALDAFAPYYQVCFVVCSSKQLNTELTFFPLYILRTLR